MTLQNLLGQMTPSAQTTDANTLQQMLTQFQNQNAPAPVAAPSVPLGAGGQPGGILGVTPQQVGGPGANENQLQGGLQTGTYGSQGTTGSFGDTSGTNTGATASTGTSTTGVND